MIDNGLGWLVTLPYQCCFVFLVDSKPSVAFGTSSSRKRLFEPSLLIVKCVRVCEDRDQIDD